MAIKNRLKVILAEKNMSQNYLCEKIGISKSTLSNIINGNQNSTLETALDLAMALNVSVEDIFYKELPKDDSYEEFCRVMEKVDYINEFYEKSVFTRNDVVVFYKALFSEYVKKYDAMILDIVTEEYRKENDINPVALKVLYGAE